jgi:mannitol-1-phosphate/altronate dehydrogenase
MVMDKQFDRMELNIEKDLETMGQKMVDEVNPYKMDKLRVVALLSSWLILSK